MERVEPYRTFLEPMWQQAQDGNLTVVSSPVILMEVLVKPIRDGNSEIEMQYREIFEANAVRLLEGLVRSVRRCNSACERKRAWRHPMHSTLRQLYAPAALSSSPTTLTFAVSKVYLS